ncbi:MAG: ELM1/GtrOC1 family putative glycosyltransferase [Candidatus Omnitrophota bacterium]
MKRLLDVLGCGALQLAARFFQWMPERLAGAVGSLLGWAAFYLHSRRSVAYADLKAALGGDLSEKERWALVRRQYGHFGRMFAEVLRIPATTRALLERNIRICGFERFSEAFAAGRGVVLMTAHFGNWELLQTVSGLLGKPVHVLNRPQKFERMNEYLNRLRETHGSVAIGRGIGIRDLLRALKRNQLIGILGDQDAGKTGGLILPFLGRKTTIPTGAFELAARTGAPVLPAFMIRREGMNHEIVVEQPILVKSGEEEAGAIQEAVGRYVGLLEGVIRRFPEQWLWATKRWKYSWTKRILILSDGKPGHLKQSQAVAAAFGEIRTQYGRPGMEYPTQTLEVRFRSAWRRKLFPWFALFWIPFVQGRLRFLRFFFEPGTQREIERASADFVISAGSSLVPLNLCLARDSRAKSIVVMKPSFPYNRFRFDLAIIPAHDRGAVPAKAVRTLLSPAQSDPGELGRAGERLGRRLRSPGRVRWSVFLGGATRRFDLDPEKIEAFFGILSQMADETGDYLVTTSRRTSDAIARRLKERLSRDPHCQLLVVANEDNPPGAVQGMMALAEVLVVTGDSISMISEAVRSGKKVMVVDLGRNLPVKHRRFTDLLAAKSVVVCAGPETFREQYAKISGTAGREAVELEFERVQSKLQEIL